MTRQRKFRAIDLYSGIGGWSLGLKMAGIKVVSSYERSQRANRTNEENNGHPTNGVDLRRFDLKSLPKDIDIVVGSPPCTQFSFANRGGKGDVTDGINDLEVFFRVVERLKPRCWALENVPRLQQILEHQMRPRGKLRFLIDMPLSIEVFDMEEFGIAQRRKRCIVGNFDFDLLRSYSTIAPRITLGDIIRSLGLPKPVDPLFGKELRRELLTDHEMEQPLTEEETRINRANKVIHPVYNSMPFPDPQNRSARTITATCTRVSRESIVIEHELEKYRRLTIRERACTQGFPISFQFFGKSFADKLRMIGNAMPPVFAFYIGHAMKSSTTNKIPTLAKALEPIKLSARQPPSTGVEVPKRRYRWNRTFRFAVPSLRLKSGVRFELANRFSDGSVAWIINFYFGTSKSIHQIELNAQLGERIAAKLPREAMKSLDGEIAALKVIAGDVESTQLQRVWTHTGPGTIRPFELLDKISESGKTVQHLLSRQTSINEMIIKDVIPLAGPKIEGREKLIRHSTTIVAGLVVGSAFNAALSRTTLVAVNGGNGRIARVAQ
jgi:DNA (cytosine-5)-methyltransferase 1